MHIHLHTVCQLFSQEFPVWSKCVCLHKACSLSSATSALNTVSSFALDAHIKAEVDSYSSKLQCYLFSSLLAAV